MAGTWSNLGTAAGSSRAGASRLELAPGEQPTPPHVHGQAEEIFYVLAGSGLTLLDDDAYEIRAGECIVRYDNEAGKGDHRHAGDVEMVYRFNGYEKLLTDFWADVDAWGERR